jgi:acetoin utilization deacetylase AcuC-like enzyme
VTTLVVSHPHCLDHQTPYGHPERADRLRMITHVLEHERFADLARDDAPRADVAAIVRVHPPEFVERLENATPMTGYVQVDGDTTLSPGSYEAALRSAGGGVFAVDEVMTGKAANAFVATRPPGHHAETATAMGFCLFNNVAIAARHARTVHGVERVAIMDFDVHHGNGTQDIFWSDPSVMYLSTHEMPLYPGTGAMRETGDYEQIVNAPLRAGDGGDEFRQAFEAVVLPRMRAFRPDLVLISAGFDAHQRDPLANLNLTEVDFGWATKKLMDVADETAGGRIVSLLEGGYDLEGLGRSVGAHVMALMRG